MLNLNWGESGERIVTELVNYFGLKEDYVRHVITSNFKSFHDKQRLIAMVDALVPFCRKGKPAFDETLTDENRRDRKKSGEAILSNPKFSDEENSFDIYQRLTRLYRSISSKGIDIYKTVYVTSLTDGNLGVKYDADNRVIERYQNEDRDFDTIYAELASVLFGRRFDEEIKADERKALNGIFEGCAATMISKVNASNIRKIYFKMLMDFWLKDKDTGKWSYLFTADKEYEGKTRYEQRSKMIKDGLIRCPSLFACKPEKIMLAFKYIVSKIPQSLIDSEYDRYQALGHNAMTKFWCKYYIAKNWIKDNFSILSINTEKMVQKENVVAKVEQMFVEENDEDYWNYYNRTSLRKIYNFHFLFENPISISIMNSIPVERMNSFAYSNILTLEKYTTSKDEILDYIKKNPYVLAMDTRKLSKLLEMIDVHDQENPDNRYMQKFLKLGKALFANKHNIDFDVVPVFNQLAKGKIRLLELDRMDDWGRLSLFVEIFCDKDPKLVSQIQMLYAEKLKRDGLGSSKVRDQIRTLLTKNGGWEQIIKDPQRLLAVTTDVKSIHDARFKIEHIEKSGDAFEDEERLQRSEYHFASKVDAVLAKIRTAYVQKKEKLTKLYTDIDKLYEATIGFLEKTCFDDVKSISTLIESELRSPLIETFERLGATVDPQVSLFGAKSLTVEVPGRLVKPLRALYSSLSGDARHKVGSDVVAIVRSRDEGKKL